MARKRFSYRDSGVDVEAGDGFASSLADVARGTRRPEVIGGIGGFAGLFRPNLSGMSEPVLVSGTDGVGTKLMVAQAVGRHETIGIDLVAMCANDVLTIGAEPLFFLDYLATGKLNPSEGQAVVRGVARGCEQAGCALLGGETAEMPGMYAPGHYDLAGFCVGLVDRPHIVDGTSIADGDVVIGLASAGIHSNGYSLVRHVVAEHGLNLESTPEGLSRPLGELLLEPTRIYVRSILAALAEHRDAITGMAHITGGGIAGNLVRVLPEGCRATLTRDAWEEPAVFGLLRRLGVPDSEMDLTFNVGLGFVVICRPQASAGLIATLRAAGETCNRVGAIQAGARGVTIA